MQSVCLDVQFSFITLQNEFDQVAQLMQKETMCMSSLAAMILHPQCRLCFYFSLSLSFQPLTHYHHFSQDNRHSAVSLPWIGALKWDGGRSLLLEFNYRAWIRTTLHMRFGALAALHTPTADPLSVSNSREKFACHRVVTCVLWSEWWCMWYST